MSSFSLTSKNTLIQQLNALRQNPETIIPYLNQRKVNYALDSPHLMLFSPFHAQKCIKTLQGPKPINQLIGVLFSKDPTGKIVQNEYLTLIAQSIGENLSSVQNLQQLKLSEQMAKGMRTQLNNCQLYDFVDKVTCIIGYAFEDQKFEPLLSLLIDDGNKLRKNRELLLAKEWKFAGAASFKLKNFQGIKLGVYLLTRNILKRDN